MGQGCGVGHMVLGVPLVLLSTKLVDCGRAHEISGICAPLWVVGGSWGGRLGCVGVGGWRVHGMGGWVVVGCCLEGLWGGWVSVGVGGGGVGGWRVHVVGGGGGMGG